MKVNAEVFEKALWDVVEILSKRHKELGMKATGDWLKSLDVKVINNSGEIWGADYSEHLAKGQPEGTFVEVKPLVRWVKAKFGYTGKQAVGMAIAVSRKIEREGTEWYKRGGSDLIEVLERYDVQELLKSRISENLKTQINDKLIRQTQKATAV